VTRSQLRLLAVDLGAESGRVAAGTFDGDRLSVSEVHRFSNVPVRIGGTLCWDFLRLFGDVHDGLRRAGQAASVGVDAWGVDFGLIDARGRLLANPVHYRDERTRGMIGRAVQRVSRAEIYARTGIQFMEINTLYQLFAMAERHDPDLERAERMLLIPDLLNHYLCGSVVSEYTNATTTQCFDVRQGDWARDLVAHLAVPTRLLPPVVPPGTVLGPLLPGVADETGGHGLRVVAPGTHDTASAVAAVPLQEGSAFLSSGTWSLLGVELREPIVTEAALEANVTNEGGVGGTIRLLRNVMGLWLLQQARQALASASGQAPTYAELTRMAESAPAHTTFIDPDDPRFLRPGDFRATLAAYCQETHQPAPEGPAQLVRTVLESLALKYALVLRQLETLTGKETRALRVVGGGARNDTLCQLTADATGLPVIAGPIEATTIGNLIVQAIALGELSSLAEARALVARSFRTRECFQQLVRGVPV
jgi:rhamnulokinase